MSVDRTDYIVYGWKLPYQIKNKNGVIDLWDDKYLPMMKGHKGEEYTIISDGMSGGYTVFGKLIISGGDKYEGWEFNDLSIDKLDANSVKAKYLELFELDDIGGIGEPTLFIFSHFS